MSDDGSQRWETRYQVFEVGSTRVGMVADAANDRAWIQSTATVPVRR